MEFFIEDYGQILVAMLVIIFLIAFACNFISSRKSRKEERLEFNYRNGLVNIEDPFEVISNFCNENSIQIPVNVMVQVSKMCDRSKFWKVFVCDLIRCKTTEELLSKGYSANYLRYFFVYCHDFVVLKEDDMLDICVNYLKDIIKYYKKKEKEVGVVEVIGVVNNDLMLSLTPYDIDEIKRVIKQNKDKVGKNKIKLFINPEIALEQKYEDLDEE